MSQYSVSNASLPFNWTLFLYWSRSQKCCSSAPLILKFATGLLNAICTHTLTLYALTVYKPHTRIVFTINQQVSHSKWISSPLYRWDGSQTQTHCSVLFNAETACCCLLDSVETGQIVSIVLVHTERKDFPCFHCHICVCVEHSTHMLASHDYCSPSVWRITVCVCASVSLHRWLLSSGTLKQPTGRLEWERERARMCFARLLIRNGSRDHPVALVTAVLNCR